MDEPLVFTSKGNLPLSLLKYSHKWLEDDVAITFVEEYRLDDEVVKRSAHSRLKQGLEALIEKQLFNGV